MLHNISNEALTALLNYLPMLLSELLYDSILATDGHIATGAHAKIVWTSLSRYLICIPSVICALVNPLDHSLLLGDLVSDLRVAFPLVLQSHTYRLLIHLDGTL